MAMDANLIEARKKRISGEISDTPGILGSLYAKKDFARVAHNVDMIARSLLLRGMMSYRVDKDVNAALADFRAACKLTDEFDRALKGIEAGNDAPARSAYLEVSDFEIPIYTCLLASNWPRALALVELMSRPAVQQKEDPARVLMARLFAAFLVDDKDKFKTLRAQYDRAKKDYWWQQLAHYIDLYESVLNRDQERFDRLTDDAEKKFLSRAVDRKFGDLRPEFGGLAENDVVVDFMSVGIGKAALKRGMRLTKDSDVIPRQLVEAG